MVIPFENYYTTSKMKQSLKNYNSPYFDDGVLKTAIGSRVSGFSNNEVNPDTDSKINAKSTENFFT